MAKRLQTPSPFSKLLDLRKARETQTAEQPDGQEADPNKQPASQPPGKLAKSVDPDYLKFTTYVRKTTHRAAKLRAVEEGRELSEVVEELVSRWAAERVKTSLNS